MTTRYDKLRELLNAQEVFPVRYLHKFIGKNTVVFEQGVVALNAAFNGLELQSRRESGGGKHVAYTYAIDARSAEEIIMLFEATERVPDLLMVL